MKTNTINVADLLTFKDRESIAKVVESRVHAKYGDMYDFKWECSISGHFEIPETL